MESFDSKEKRRALFKSYDLNANGYMSLAELDRMVKYDKRFEPFRSSKAILRAYKRADDPKKKGHVGWINRAEFRDFLYYLPLYQNLWEHFSKADENYDGRVSLLELKKAEKDLQLEPGEVEKVFKEIDSNKGGYILFDEWCDYYIEKELAKLPPEEDD